MCHKILVDKIKALSQFWKPYILHIYVVYTTYILVAFLLTDHILHKYAYKSLKIVIQSWSNFNVYANPVWNHIHLLPNKVASQNQHYIQDNNDYCTLSIKILEKKFFCNWNTEIPSILHIWCILYICQHILE